jgi:DNA-binding CsgD family transcriptional regulator
MSWPVGTPRAYPSGAPADAAVVKQGKAELDSPEAAFVAGHLPLQILDHLHFGVMVVDRRLRVLFANRAAHRECERHPLMRVEGDSLVVAPTRQLDGLARAIGAAAEGRWSMVQLGADADDHLLMTVLPLQGSGRTDDVPALVVFGLGGGSKDLSLQFYARSCGLTSTETRVLAALAEGVAPREIARRHGVALSTVRTQLGSIRSRTGTRSITELVRLLGSLPPIMPMALAGLC